MNRYLLKQVFEVIWSRLDSEFSNAFMFLLNDYWKIIDEKPSRVDLVDNKGLRKINCLEENIVGSSSCPVRLVEASWPRHSPI